MLHQELFDGRQTERVRAQRAGLSARRGSGRAV